MQEPYIAICSACGDSSPIPEEATKRCSRCSNDDNNLIYIRKLKATFQAADGNDVDPIFVPNNLVDNLLGYNAVELYSTAESEFELLLSQLYIKGEKLRSLTIEFTVIEVKYRTSG